MKNYILGMFVVLLLTACGGGDGGDGGGASSGSSSKEQLNRNFEVCDITFEGMGVRHTLNPLPSSINLHIGESAVDRGVFKDSGYLTLLIFDDGILNANTYDTSTDLLWYIVSAADCSYSVLSGENRVSAGPYYIVLINSGSSEKAYRYEITLNAAS